MKRELKYIFYTKKHLIIITFLLLAFVFIWWNFISISPSDIDFERYNAYGNFVTDVEIYGDKEELQTLYDNIVKQTPQIPGMISSVNNEKSNFLKAVYSFALKYDLPYDSYTQFTHDAIKYNQFSYFNTFASQMGLFIYIIYIIIGCFYQSMDMRSKIGKLIYTSGEKRNNIIAKKYLFSLSLIIVLVLIVDIFMSLLALIYMDSGVKYCIIYTTTNTLYFLNYFQIVLMTICSHILSVLCIFTLSYYLSLIFKNGVIAFATLMIFSLMGLYCASIADELFTTFFAMLMNGGFVQCLVAQNKYSTDLSSVLLYIPVIILPILTVLISIPFIKIADLSR